MFTITWGNGDAEKGREIFPTLIAVREWFEQNTVVTIDLIDALLEEVQRKGAIYIGPISNWVRVEQSAMKV
jgi:hypothetical protein